MLRIALVEYINTRPFLDGLEKHFQAEEVELITLSPSACGIALKEGKCDLALIPVGSIPELSKLEILPNYCIGSNGLARILLAQHWKLSPELIMPDSRDFSLLTGGTAGVVIGDQAIRLRENYAHVYDLSQAWQEMTGLPFAFAVWASHQGRLTPIWRQRLNAAFADGVQQAAESATKWAEHFDIDPVFAHQYLTQHIDFRFTAARHRALHLYLHHLQSLPSLANHELHHIRP